MNKTFFTVMDNASGKFIDRFTAKSKRVYLVKNPFNSNYFIERRYAESWLTDSELDRDKYSVKEFESIPQQSNN